MPLNDTVEIALRLLCRNLPADCGLRLGVQKDREVIDDVGPGAVAADFLVPVRLRSGPTGDDFAGPFVHGKRGARFLYLVWGTRADADGSWTTTGRAKLPLVYLTRARLGAAQRPGAPPIEIEIDMTTDRRGEPLCATIPAHHLSIA